MSIVKPTNNYAKIVKFISDYSTEMETLRRKVERSLAEVQSSINDLMGMNIKYEDLINALPIGSEKETDYQNLDIEREEMAIGFTALMSRLAPNLTEQEILDARTILGL